MCIRIAVKVLTISLFYAIIMRCKQTVLYNKRRQSDAKCNKRRDNFHFENIFFGITAAFSYADFYQYMGKRER